jgi:hypothetical protein
MQKKIFRLALISFATATLALPFVLAVWAYPKTANCPIDGTAARATGKKRTSPQGECTDVEYRHKGTDYSDPTHPQRFNHVFWVTHCGE